MSELDLTDRQRQLKARFTEQRGTWGDAWEAILRLDPDFLESYLKLSMVPWTSGVLEPKVKEFVYLAMDAAATHLYVPGIRQHIQAALAVGATQAELMEVLELTSTLGIHAANIGVPLLLEVLDEEGMRGEPTPLTEEQERIKAEFTANRGYWHEFWDGILELMPELLDAYTDFSSVPWKTGVLEPKVKELIYCAFDAAATHLYAPGLKAHMRNALRLGATKEEVAEVLSIVSVLGIHGATTAAPVLLEELRRSGAEV